MCMIYIKGIYGRYVYNVGMYASYICIVNNNHLPSLFLLATLLQFYSIELLLLCFAACQQVTQQFYD